MSTEKKVVELNVDDILPNRFQPRIKFDEIAIADLSASIREHGVIQPLVVRKIGDKYEIIAGERRYKASVMAGLETVPAIITELNDKDSAEVALIENVQRQNLTPIEEAISYKKILDMGYLTQEQLANKLGKSQSSIANKLRLLNLEDDVQEALLNGQISERHARSLLKLPNNKQTEMLDRIIDERLTVRRTDEEIDKMLNDLFEAEDEANGTEKKLEALELQPEEKEEEIEHTQPLRFNFGSVVEEDKKETQNNESFGNETIPDSTDFFGFNQNIMPEEPKNINEPIKDDYNTNATSNDFVDVNKIQEQAQDLYPKEEKKDINSFLEPTLLLNDEEEKEKTVDSAFDQINASVESDEPTNDLAGQIFAPASEDNPFVTESSDNVLNEEPVQEQSMPFGQSTVEEPQEPSMPFGEPTVEEPQEPSMPFGEPTVEEPQESSMPFGEPTIEEPQYSGVQPGKFFNLFNDNSDTSNFNSMFEEPGNVGEAVSPVEQEADYNRVDVNPMDSFNNNESMIEQPVTEEVQPEVAPENNIFGNYNTFSFDNSNDVQPINDAPVTNFSDTFNSIPENDELKEVIPQSLDSDELTGAADFEVNKISLAQQKIKECAEVLKQLGININVEESDFENKYQVTFNIDK